MSKRVLVAYATHHGATRGFAARIETTLTCAGLDASARSVTDAGDFRDWDEIDAFVVIADELTRVPAAV